MSITDDTGASIFTLCERVLGRRFSVSRKTGIKLAPVSRTIKITWVMGFAKKDISRLIPTESYPF